MNRREFLRSAGLASASFVLPASQLFADGAVPSNWRTFVVTTRVEVLKPAGVTRVWLPAALIRETPFQRTLSNRYECVGGQAKMVISNQDAVGIVSAEFPNGVKPVLTLISRIATKDYTVNLATPRQHHELSGTELEHFLRPTKLLPTDGIVRDNAMEITRGASTDFDKARCIYEWIVENTFRDPKVRGCGAGDIRWMLETKNLGGKCADLNALYVGLARSVGLPARDAYGIRIAKSRLGYRSLGPSTSNITTAQHCRAEVYLRNYGWVPVDPADVRKVVLEEPPGNLSINDEMVKRARKRLFGSWEMNWMAFNFAHDVSLPGSKGPTIGFLMYPQAETAEGRLDSLDPKDFKYEVTAQEITPL